MKTLLITFLSSNSPVYLYSQLKFTEGGEALPQIWCDLAGSFHRPDFFCWANDSSSNTPSPLPCSRALQATVLLAIAMVRLEVESDALLTGPVTCSRGGC